MVSISHNNIINTSVATNDSPRLGRHGRRINEDLMLSNIEKQSVEIDPLLVGKLRPLPYARKDLVHTYRLS